jgi:hypothetical protein
MEGKKSDPVPITKLPVQKLQEILKQIETVRMKNKEE